MGREGRVRGPGQGIQGHQGQREAMRRDTDPMMEEEASEEERSRVLWAHTIINGRRLSFTRKAVACHGQAPPHVC